MTYSIHCQTIQYYLTPLGTLGPGQTLNPENCGATLNNTLAFVKCLLASTPNLGS